MNTSLSGEMTIAFSIAQEILMTSVNIPTIPANGKKILDMVRQPEDQIDIPSLVKLVESDPGLLTKILQLANSIFYSELDKIVSLRAAVTRIGLSDTVNTVCLHFFQDMLPRFPDIQGFSYHDFWSHSWVCAVANRRLGHPNFGMDVLPGDLYMTGMLQGLGKLLLAIHFPEKFSACVQKSQDRQQPLQSVEREIFGTTDAYVASKVLHSWHLPAMVCEGIAFHQEPDLAPPEYRIIAGLTQFACCIAQTCGIGSSGDGLKTEFPATFLGQNPNLRFSHKTVQDSLVKEVLNSMEKMVAEATATPQKSQSRKSNLKQKNEKKSAPGTASAKKSQKGMFGWVRSLWNGG